MDFGNSLELPSVYCAHLPAGELQQWVDVMVHQVENGWWQRRCPSRGRDGQANLQRQLSRHPRKGPRRQAQVGWLSPIHLELSSQISYLPSGTLCVWGFQYPAFLITVAALSFSISVYQPYAGCQWSFPGLAGYEGGRSEGHRDASRTTCTCLWPLTWGCLPPGAICKMSPTVALLHRAPALRKALSLESIKTQKNVFHPSSYHTSFPSLSQ